MLLLNDYALITLGFLATSGDVLHSWAVPSLGLKADSIPGKIVRKS